MVLVAGEQRPPRARHPAAEALHRRTGEGGLRARARCHARRPAALSRARLRGDLGLSPAAARDGAAVARRTAHCADGTTIRPIADADLAAAFAPMMPRPSAPTAAHCCTLARAAAGSRTGARNATAASPASCSAATAAPRRNRPAGRGGRCGCACAAGTRARRDRRRRSISISPTRKTDIRAWLAACGFAAQRPLTRMLLSAARQASTTRRAPSRWSARSSAERHTEASCRSPAITFMTGKPGHAWQIRLDIALSTASAD